MCPDAFNPWVAFALGVAVPVVPWLVVGACIAVRDARDRFGL